MRKFGLMVVILIAACAPVADVKDNGQMIEPFKLSDIIAENMTSWREGQPSWYAPVPPFRVIGDADIGVYFVGTKGLGMYFIPTDQGHIVLDGGMPDQGSYVANAIRKLGYDPADIKILLNSHAHLDHSGGLAELKAISGARLIASEGDRSALEGGFYLGFEDNKALNAPPVKVDRVISDGEQVKLGAATLTARITPGHSRGCTSWMMDIRHGSQNYQTLFFCSATVAANKLFPEQYEGIVADYRKTFATTKDWKPDVFLANHPFFTGLLEKREKQLAGDPLAFVNAGEFPKTIAKLEQAFEKAVISQSAIMEK